MWPDRVSNLGSLINESGALPTTLRSPAISLLKQEWPYSKPEQPCRSCLSANSGSLKLLNCLAHFGDFMLKRLFAESRTLAAV